MQENMTYFFIIGAVVVALAALAALVNYVVSTVTAFRRSPPLPEEVAKAYATKRELAELKTEIKSERDRVDKILAKQFDLIRKLSEDTFEKFSALMSSLKEWQLGIERMIGRIEGKVNTK